MSEETLVLAVGSYEARAAAERDLQQVDAASRQASEPLVAAILEKGADGQLRLDRQVDAGRDPTWARTLLGAALTVIAAPIGIAFLAPVVHGAWSWSGVASLVGVLWHHIAKEDLRRMSELLETSQAAIVLIAITADRVDIAARLSGSKATIVNDAVSADLRRAFAHAVAEAGALS
jgi:hypothetical protein